MNWDGVETFVAVAERGSLAKAGKHLGVNHSTVLRRISQLEQDLGVALFAKLASGYQITPVGELLLVQAKEMQANAYSLQRLAANYASDESGPLNIAIPPPDSLGWADMLREFHWQYPEIDLHVNAKMALSDLELREADVSLRFTSNPPENYIGYELVQMQFSLYASEQYLQTYSMLPSSIIEVKDWVIVNMENINDSFETWLEALPNAKPAIRVNSMELAAQAVASGFGATYLPEHLAKPYSNLVRLEVEELDYKMSIWAMIHQDLRFHPRVKRFIEFVRHYLPEHYPHYKV